MQNDDHNHYYYHDRPLFSSKSATGEIPLSWPKFNPSALSALWLTWLTNILKLAILVWLKVLYSMYYKHSNEPCSSVHSKKLTDPKIRKHRFWLKTILFEVKSTQNYFDLPEHSPNVYSTWDVYLWSIYQTSLNSHHLLVAHSCDRFLLRSSSYWYLSNTYWDLIHFRTNCMRITSFLYLHIHKWCPSINQIQ